MADFISWVKQLAFLVLFAGFIELLLPANNLRGCLKLVVGVMVMMTVLLTLLKFTNADWQENEVAAIEVDRKFDDGKTVTKTKDNLVLEKLYHDKMLHIISKTVAKASGKVVNVKIDWQDDNDSFAKQINIKKINIEADMLDDADKKHIKQCLINELSMNSEQIKFLGEEGVK